MLGCDINVTFFKNVSKNLPSSPVFPDYFQILTVYQSFPSKEGALEFCFG